MMKCIECGHELKDGAIFCIRCGAMQVSMDGSPLEKQEWPEVEPQSDGSGWRSSADGARPSANAQHSRDFTPAPQRGGGRIIAIIIAIIVVLAIVAFAAFQCMAPAASGGDESTAASSESSAESDSAVAASANSASASSAAASSSAASASSAAAASAESASAAAASGQGAATEETPTIVGGQTQAQPQQQQQTQPQPQPQQAQPQPQPQQAQPPAAAPAAPAPSVGDYVLADSSTRSYSQSELEAMSASDLYYARNEIFARHGRMFQRADLQDYFNSKSWYNPQYSPEQWNNLPNQLNNVEVANASLMKQVEQSKGSPYL